MLLSIKGPFEGKIGDANLWRLTNTPTHLEALQTDDEPLFLYGDIGYEGCYQVITQYRRSTPLSEAQKEFNDWLSAHRITVEQIFGFITNTWKKNTLTLELRPQIEAVAAWYAVSVLLVNIKSCLRGNVASKRYQINTPTLEQYLSAITNDSSGEEDTDLLAF